MAASRGRRAPAVWAGQCRRPASRSRGRHVGDPDCRARTAVRIVAAAGSRSPPVCISRCVLAGANSSWLDAPPPLVSSLPCFLPGRDAAGSAPAANEDGRTRHHRGRRLAFAGLGCSGSDDSHGDGVTDEEQRRFAFAPQRDELPRATSPAELKIASPQST